MKNIQLIIRRSNIRIIGIAEGAEREKEAESFFKELIAENFPYLGKEVDLQVHEANRTLNYINAKRPSPRHIIVKLAKVNDKERILWLAERKKIAYKGIPIKL